MTSPEPRAPNTSGGDREPSSQVGLWITIGALVVMLVILAAWFVVDRVRAQESATPAEVERVIDDYLAAWSDKDEAALRANHL